MFNPNSLYYTDAYKVGHRAMLAPNTTREYATEIPRSLKYGPEGATHIVNFGKQIVWRWIHDQFEENFFKKPLEDGLQFVKDMSLMLMAEYDGDHFTKLHKLGFLPIRVCSIPEGMQVKPGIPTSDYINTIDGYAWLSLYLETIASALSWKPMLAATIALQYKKNATEWVKKTDNENLWLVDYMCHDFSARGLNPHDMLSVGLGHATSFRGSDTLITIPAARYYYYEPNDEVIINSVVASEHSVTCTGIFYYERKLRSGELNYAIEEYYSFDAPCEGSVNDPDFKAISEWLNLRDWIKKFPKGILSIVSDTFDLWKLITFILPRLKKEIMTREGKLVIRPDSGNPVDIVCGLNTNPYYDNIESLDEVKGLINNTEKITESEWKGVIQLLYEIFGGDKSREGFIRLDSHIGTIYGDSITLQRQVEIYSRLANKGFAATNIVLGVGSYTYAYNTRDSIGLAYKGAWFERKENGETIFYDIYKDPITDDGTKKSLRGFQFVYEKDGEIHVESGVSEEKHNSSENLLQPIYIDGAFRGQVDFKTIRNMINKLV